ncbi:MAG: imidazole glycerol phosphate synthase subunit HisH [Firmicutes bacterium]|nr:imidazole glycerol phosphate synthase subunit HisH [Bacillota bacterium]
MITIIDYGLGNLRSVQKAFEHLGHKVFLTSKKEDITDADHLVLPGVGAFGAGMRNLHQYGLVEAIQEYLASDRPFLGICLGLQLLFTESEESFAGERPKGLGFFRGTVRRFPEKVKVPQIGWNSLKEVRDHPILHGISDGDYFYFVHSYHAPPEVDEVTLAKAEYGLSYPAIVGRGKVCALQFHPEKSSRLGLKILDNFASMKA